MWVNRIEAQTILSTHTAEQDTVNRRSNGTPYRRVKGTPFVNSAMVVERGPCAARGAGRA